MQKFAPVRRHAFASARDVSEKMLSAAESSRKRGTEKAESGQGPLKKAKAAASQGWVAWKDGDGNEFLAERPVQIKDEAGSFREEEHSLASHLRLHLWEMCSPASEAHAR